MPHADLDRRIDELLGRGRSGQFLIEMLNNAFLKAGVSDRIKTFDDVPKLSEEAVRAGLARLSHQTYDRDYAKERTRKAG